ncbi:50S ribosomal protein L23 [Patescibacteria group bacterium]|nr:50S ribosomal protein L23 [Patescibacteria group bacterium]
MGLFNRKKEQKTELVKKSTRQESPVKVAREKSDKPAVANRKVIKKEFTEAYRLLRRPLVTEKSVNLSSLQNQYSFAVAPEASKNEVKKVIQDLYGVRVLRVNILNTKGKKRRVGRHEGFKPGFKKAIVFLPEGEKIEVISR